MTRLGHALLKYLLIIPPLLSMCLGALSYGAVKYTIQTEKERLAFEVKLQSMTLRQLSEVEI